MSHAAATAFGLQVNVKKTVVMHQAPSHDKSLVSNTNITLNGTKLNVVTTFTYLGSILSDDALVYSELTARIRKASCSFGRLYDRVWSQRGLHLSTKIQVYRAVVLSALLYGCETWTLHMRHVRLLESFHIRHLRAILRIRWQDRITNEEVLQRAQMTSLEAMLIKAQLRWSGHVLRMDDSRLPKCVLYGELSSGKRHPGGQYLRYKDSLKRPLNKCNIGLTDWEEQASYRSVCRGIIHDGINHFEANRAAQAQVRRSTRKLKSPSDIISQRSSSSNLTCSVCGRICAARIGLFSHLKTHKSS